MDIFRIIGIGLAGGVLTVAVRHCKPEYGVLTGLITVAVMLMLFMTLDAIVPAINGITKITNRAGVDAKYVAAVVKVVGIAYVSQFGAEVLRDSGENAIASKVELAGKVVILGLTLPIVREFLEVCINALSAV